MSFYLIIIDSLNNIRRKFFFLNKGFSIILHPNFLIKRKDMIMEPKQLCKGIFILFSHHLFFQLLIFLLGVLEMDDDI